jgi:hypothetical protein
MASIDKTYIDGKEYPIYRQWWIDNYDKMVKELGEAIWLYTFSIFEFDYKGRYVEEEVVVTPEFLKNNTKDIDHYVKFYDFAIWNTSEKEDRWLVKNCPIESFRIKMIEVYPRGWSGFKGQSWVPKKNNKPKCIK